MKFLLIGLLLTAALSPPAQALKPAIDQQNFTFGRYHKTTTEESMQMPIVRYAPADGSTGYVDLIGAVHVGDAAYYLDLNERFKSYDSVLFEMVMPENAQVPSNQPIGQSSPVSMLQNGLKNILGLAFQLDVIDYQANNLVHADMTPQEMRKSMDRKGESWTQMIFKLMREGMIQQASGASHMSNGGLMLALFSGDTQTELKRLMAMDMVNMDDAMDALEGQEGSTLIAERNKKALHVLKRELANPKNQKVAIFYGAAHLKDMGQRLIDQFGLIPVSVEWVDAWKIK